VAIRSANIYLTLKHYLHNFILFTFIFKLVSYFIPSKGELGSKKAERTTASILL